jgi:ubiquinone/menaquinone biosynthesis C-methylase UbiE
MASRFDPAQFDRLESPERRKAMSPERLLRKLGLTRGMVFVDVGAGTGFFSLPAAALVGPLGKVYALDVEPSMLERLRAKGPPPWLEAVQCGEKRLPLKESIADRVFACFVLHETEDPAAFLKEMGRVAKPRVPIVVVEWAKRRQPEGPPFGERLHHHRTEALFLEAGLCFRSLEFLNPSQYVVTGFRK